MIFYYFALGSSITTFYLKSVGGKLLTGESTFELPSGRSIISDSSEPSIHSGTDLSRGHIMLFNTKRGQRLYSPPSKGTLKTIYRNSTTANYHQMSLRPSSVLRKSKTWVSEGLPLVTIGNIIPPSPILNFIFVFLSNLCLDSPLIAHL